MIIAARLWIIVVLGLATTTAVATAAEKVGVVSLIPGQLQQLEVGFTVFGTRSASVETGAWRINDKVNEIFREEIKKQKPEVEAVNFQELAKTNLFIVGRDKQLLNQPAIDYLVNYGKQNGVKTILVIGAGTSGDSIGNSKFFLYGQGLYYDTQQNVHNYVALRAYVIYTANGEEESFPLLLSAEFGDKPSLESQQKEKIFQFVSPSAKSDSVRARLHDLIFKENINSLEVKRQLISTFENIADEDTVSDETYQLNRLLNPPHHTLDSYHLLPESEKDKLRALTFALYQQAATKLVSSIPLEYKETVTSDSDSSSF